jgi:hypothetical protein
VINLGLEVFAEELERTGIAVDWRPLSGVAGVAALLARFDDGV